MRTFPDTDFEGLFVETPHIVAKVPLQEVRYLILQHLVAVWLYTHYNNDDLNGYRNEDEDNVDEKKKKKKKKKKKCTMNEWFGAWGPRPRFGLKKERNNN